VVSTQRNNQEKVAFTHCYNVVDRVSPMV